MPRRRPELPVGAGMPGIPYDQTGGTTMPGMEIPSPAGTMKKMVYEFTDPADAAAQQAPQIPPGAGVPPAGAQEPIPPAGAQPPGGMPQGQDMGLLAGLGGQPQQFPSDMLSDADLGGMLQEDPMDPMELEADEMHQTLMDPNADPMQQEEMRKRLLMAAQQGMGGGF